MTFIFQLHWKTSQTRWHAAAWFRLSLPLNCLYSEIDFSLSGDQSMPYPRLYHPFSFSILTNEGHKTSSSCPFFLCVCYQFKSKQKESCEMSFLIDCTRTNDRIEMTILSFFDSQLDTNSWVVKIETQIKSIFFIFSLYPHRKRYFAANIPLVRYSNYFSLDSQHPNRPLGVLILELGHL